MNSLHVPFRRAGILLTTLLVLVAGIWAPAQVAGPTNQLDATAVQAEPDRAIHRAGEVLIKFRSDVTDEQIGGAFRGAGLRMVKQVITEPMRRNGEIGFTHALTTMPVEAAVRLLNQLPGIEYAQPNWVYMPHVVSTDPYFTDGSLWGMYGASTSPANSFGSGAAAAWEAGSVGSKGVFVGVVDEGLQFNHADLAANIWQNPGEWAKSPGVDDDLNGYIDDIYGWNAYGDNGTIYEPGSDDHGTHVAGTIGAGDNGLGVVGVNWNVNIISGKFLGPSGGTTADAIQAIDYMTNLKNRGVNIVALNNSWGGGAYDAALLEAIVRAANAQILFVVSAGNGNRVGRAINTDSSPVYPACYNTTAGAGYDAVISVTAIDSVGAKPTWANYGATTVDLGAPGVGIVSTVPTDTYASYSGTSMAAPHVTGAIALYAAKYPGVKAQDIRNALLASTTATASLSGTVTKGRLDVVKFLAIVPPNWTPPDPSAPPMAPSDPIATPISPTQIRLTWKDNSNNESEFRITRTPASPDSTITVPANVTTYTDSGLTPNTSYSYSIEAWNSIGSSSAVDSAPAKTPLPPPPATVTFVKTDTATQGSWLGNYGREGYDLFNSSYKSPPSYVTPVPANYTPHTWSALSTDKRALQTPSGSSRFAACYYSFDTTGKFSIDLNFVDTGTHRVSLYCLDWDPQQRQQTIEIVDRNYDTPLDSQSVDSFSGGKYLVWDITGPVIIKIKWVDNPAITGDNAVVSGIFFDDPNYTPPTPPATPTGLAATAVSKSQINLAWTDNSSNETGFKIERSKSATTGFAVIATVGAGVTSYQNTGLARNTTYYYRVRATNSGSDSDPSNTAQATTLAR